jgi:hypothetical protein
MPWYTPVTVVDGQLMKATFWNEQVRDNINAVQQMSFPVGSIFKAVVSTNPNTLLGFGTWVAFGTGRVTVCYDETNDFNAPEKTGGAKTHTLTADEISHGHTINDPGHLHSLSYANNTQMIIIMDSAPSSYMEGSSESKGVEAADQPIITINPTTGGGSAHNNLMPYIVVYQWKRTA